MAYFKNLRAIRATTGLSQNKLATRANVSRDLVSKAEGGGDCTEEKLYALLGALNDYYYGSRKPLQATDCIFDELPPNQPIRRMDPS